MSTPAGSTGRSYGWLRIPCASSRRAPPTVMRTAMVAMLGLLGLGAVLAGCGGGVDELDADYIAWGSSGSTVTVAWLPIEGATSYTIERGTSEADLVPVATFAPPETSYLDTALSPMTAYTYRFSYTAADGT